VQDLKQASLGLQPHRLDRLKASSYPRLTQKLIDVVGMYLDPPGKALVLWMDEKSQIHLILDNYATHKHKNVQRWLKRHNRFHLHFAPTSSWLN